MRKIILGILITTLASAPTLGWASTRETGNEPTYPTIRSVQTASAHDTDWTGRFEIQAPHLEDCHGTITRKPSKIIVMGRGPGGTRMGTYKPALEVKAGQELWPGQKINAHGLLLTLEMSYTEYLEELNRAGLTVTDSAQNEPAAPPLVIIQKE